MNINDFILTHDEQGKVDYSLFSKLSQTMHEHKLQKELRDISLSNVCDATKKLFNSLSILFYFTLRSDSEGFEPQFIFGDKRSILPEDFDIKFNTYLNEISHKIQNPFVLSRICDVCWCNNKREKSIAIRAIESYAEMINTAVHNVYHNDDYDISELLFIKNSIDRALFISNKVYSKKSERNLLLNASLNSLYRMQNEKGIFEGFNHLTKVIYLHKLGIDSFELASNAQRMAELHKQSKYFEAVKQLFYTASNIYQRINEIDKSRSCKLSAASITVSYLNSLDNIQVKVSWLRTAIAEYKQIGGAGDIITKLKKELVELRRQSVDLYITHEHEMDLSEIVEDALTSVNGMSLPNIIRITMKRMPLENINAMRDSVTKSLKQGFFSQFFSTEIHDEDGRRIHSAAPISNHANISDEEVVNEYLKTIGISHHIFIEGVFEPVRKYILDSFYLNSFSFSLLALHSPVIKPELRDVFSIGFYKLWQGDYISAAYILIPQMESIVRYHYKNNGKDPTRFIERGLEESTSLSTLLNANFYNDIELIFSKDIALTIDLIFNKKNGPSLRHRLAHGNLHTGWCYTASTVYACFFIFYLCAYPLWEHLDEIIDVRNSLSI